MCKRNGCDNSANSFINIFGVNHLICEEVFKNKINTIIAHELIHLLMVDFYRSAILMIDDEKMKKELIYKYEQFTTRLQNAFTILDSQIENLRMYKLIKESEIK